MIKRHLTLIMIYSVLRDDN